MLYLVFIAFASAFPGGSYLFFPELGALAHDVFVRPGGKWANALISLSLMPALAAAAGVACASFLPYGYVSLLLIVGISVILLQATRSPLAPAISAGVLPLAFEIKSWSYPLAILAGTALLAALTLGWRSWCAPRMPAEVVPHRDRVDDILESNPRRWKWIPPFLIFLLVGITLVEWTGWRLILFPPIIVIAFEMFSHPLVCPWARKPMQMPLACFLAAGAGLLAISIFGNGVLATMLSFAAAAAILRLFDLHVPPAFAVALIPQIMPHPTWRYPVEVLIGTTLLTAQFLLWRRFSPPRPRSR